MKCRLIAVLLMAVVLFGCLGGGYQPPVPSPTAIPTMPPIQTPSFQTPTPAHTQTPAGTPAATPAQSATATPAPTAAPTAQAASVEIHNFAFNPNSLTVPVGTTVTWTNHDSVPHTITGDSGGTLASPSIPSGQAFSYTFTQPGTYTYNSINHTTKHGTVTVTP